jgi:hypothetical protein
MTRIQDDIEAFKAMQSRLEAESMGQWVVIRDRRLIDVYTTFEIAAAEAVRQFGAGPYLIRQIGAPPLSLPASVMFRPEASR